MQVTVGRIVQYRLSADDLLRITQMRGKSPDHGGNPHDVGQVVPLVVVVVWPNEHGPNYDGVNGQAFLDGNDTLWVTSAKEGTEPGQWSWPERVPETVPA